MAFFGFDVKMNFGGAVVIYRVGEEVHIHLFFVGFAEGDVVLDFDSLNTCLVQHIAEKVYGVGMGV